MNLYVLEDLNDPAKLKTEYRSSSAGTICVIDEVLAKQAFKIVDNIITDQVPRMAVDSNGDPVTETSLDENGDVIVTQLYDTDGNGDIITDTVETIMGKTAILDDAAEVIRLANEAQNTIEGKHAAMRAERDRLLSETDYILMPDYPMADKSAFESYRQILRDLPSNIVDIDNFSYPVKPE